MEWVQKCFDCTAAFVFRDLRRDIETDVSVRNGQLVAGATMRFEVESVQGGQLESFRVKRLGPPLAEAVDFSHDGSLILCHTEQWKTIQARPRLNNEGECCFRLLVDGSTEDLLPWQYRKKMLEDLFRF